MSNASLVDLSTEFAGRRALVTGGSRGMGAAIAQRLLVGGASVVVAARTRRDETPTNATFIAGDVGSDEGAKAIAQQALKVLGGLDILVNNAGSAKPFLPGSMSVPDDEWVAALNMNYLSAVRVTRALLPALRESNSGTIVNISSGSATPVAPPLLHYGAAKVALNSFSKGLARELAPSRIRVNIVTPGHILTPGGDEIRQTLSDAMKVPVAAMFAQIPLGQPGDPKEVAEVVAFLASDRGRWITGQNYHVDGGMGI
jgi:NAD(P)-dependent dehydrogenase (short-subunit alcohol dehydrogenase family)